MMNMSVPNMIRGAYMTDKDQSAHDMALIRRGLNDLHEFVENSWPAVSGFVVRTVAELVTVRGCTIS